MPGEIGTQQMVGDERGLHRIAAHAADDQRGDGAKMFFLEERHDEYSPSDYDFLCGGLAAAAASLPIKRWPVHAPEASTSRMEKEAAF